MAITVGTDSYIDVAGADAYFAGRLHAEAWESLGASGVATKEKALKQATRDIDRAETILHYRGTRLNPAQPLAFPRNYETAISEDVKRATCEQALFILEETSWDRERERLKAAGVRSKTVGGASETFGGGSLLTLAPLAKEYLRRYLQTVGRLA